MPQIFPTLNLVAHDYLTEANGAPAIATFARASSGYRVDALGLLESVGKDVLRQDYDPITGEHRGWLIEDSRTNLLLHSEALGDPFWDKVASSITPDAATAPDDASTADKLVEDTSTGAHSVRRLNALTSGVTYTGSVFVKAAERATLRITLGFGGAFGTTQTVDYDLAAGAAALNSGTPAFGMEPFPDGWYRCWLRQTATGTASTNFNLNLHDGTTNSYAGDGSSGLYLWGAQFEAGRHAGSYIRTEGAQATRAADQLTVPLSAFSYNPREGTLFATVSLERLPASNAEADRQHVQELFGADNEIRWFFREDGLAFLSRRDGGSFSSADNRLVIPALATKTVYRCVVAFTQEDFVIAVDAQLSHHSQDLNGDIALVVRCASP